LSRKRLENVAAVVVKQRVHQLLLATRNSHKSREFAEMLGANFIVSDLATRTDLPEVESGRTFEENALLKAVTISRLVPGLVVADDSGLEVEALGGAPGIYSARYAGLQATDTANLAKLLAEIVAAGIDGEPAAQFRCVLAVARAGTLLQTFSGVVSGVIARVPTGAHGFGYDPVFKPEGSSVTFAAMGDHAKNAISHRARAVEKLHEFLRALRPGG
jgi:XTP/dITP diphosphohydrolase